MDTKTLSRGAALSLLAGLALLISGCGGGDAGPAGPAGPPGPPGVVLTGNPESLKVSITSVTVASAPVVQFRVTDGADIAYAGVTASALRFVCWLFGAIVRCGLRGRSKKLQRVLNFAERAVEAIIFVRALARNGPLPKKRRRFASAPPGFRIAHARLKLFYKRANIRARKASAIERVFALIEALQNPEGAIAYFLKRIRKGLHCLRVIIAAPIAEVICAALAPLPQDVFDSS